MRATLVLMALVAVLVSSVPTNAGTIARDLADAMTIAQDQQLIRIYIKPHSYPDLAVLDARASRLTLDQRREFVFGELKKAARENQAPILSLLEQQALSGSVRDIRPLWVSNVVGARATKSVINELARMESVNSIELVTYENAIIGTPNTRKGSAPNPPLLMPDTVWNIELIDAPCAWEQGYTGQNIVVGHFDTGVNYNHVDLSDHLWVNSAEIPNNGIDDDGNGYIDDYYGYDFANDDSDPMDDYSQGHGTHTAGTVAGDGTAGRNTGVAPDAQIMCLKVLDYSGSGAEFDVWEAIQYALNMDADVLTLSIGWLYEWSPDRATWRGSFDVVRVGGVCAAVAAGNERQWQFLYPPPENLRVPGDVPPPWLHPDQTLTGGLSGVVSVGATDNLDFIANFSSLGPVSWQTIVPYSDYPYSPGMGLIDPDVCAPGENITSLRHSNNSGYISGYDGTSMACPHVAGLMALMLSKNPTLTPAAVDSIIEMTALPRGSMGKDNDYGSGRIRVCEAINAVVGVLEKTSPDRLPVSPVMQVAPNPFRKSVKILLELGTKVGSVSLYDTRGRLVKTIDLPDGSRGELGVSLTWSGDDSFGRPVNAGIYFIKAHTARGVLTKKVVLLK